MSGEAYIRVAVESGDSLISVLLITALVMIACAAIAMVTSLAIALIGSALPARRATRCDLLRSLSDE